MLVVRVKRYRYDEPAEELCVFEDTAPLHKKKKSGITTQLSGLATGATSRHEPATFTSTASPGPFTNQQALSFHGEHASSTLIPEGKSKNKIILRRISTLDRVSTKSALDSETVKVFHDRKDSTEDCAPQQQRKRAKVIVAQGGTKSLPVAGRESCIVVDMMQITNMKELEVKRAAEQSSMQPLFTPSKTKILDPATRALARGILVAIKNGDFSDISEALLQGANPSYRLDDEKGGYTALMAACMKSNVRMVKRLISENVDVLASNKDGHIAIDLVRESKFNPNDSRDIKIALQAAMIKAHKQNNKISQGGGTGVGGDALPASDFVVDIYCIKREEMTLAGDEASDQPELLSSGISEGIGENIVHIEGLRILEDGQVELVSYDSDWSDLADDEDPDSNDERYFANDYPDESDDDNGGGLFDDGDDRADHGSDSDEDYDTMKKEFRNRKAHLAKSRREVNQEIEDELAAVLTEGGRSGGPIFDRHNSVGRVIRPHTIGVADSLDQNSESLRAIWDTEIEDDEDNMPMKDRLLQMRIRTGMAFASNPREFNEAGLPKYGFDLSDDDQDRLDMVHGVAHAKPSRETLAYDSEMDQSDSD